MLHVCWGHTHSVRQLKEARFPLSYRFCQVKQKESRLHPKTKHSGLRAKCWMDEPCGSTLTDAPLQWSDLCRCCYQTECTCKCSTTQDWFMEMFRQTGMHRDAALMCTTQVYNSYIEDSRGRRSLYLACHISSLATRSQDEGLKLFKHKKMSKSSRSLSLNNNNNVY